MTVIYCRVRIRGIIANIILKHTNNYMMYTSPNVIQNRNEHNLMHDFKDEIEMYFHNENILDYIDTNINNNFSTIKELMSIIYNNLLTNKVITQKDITILNTWIKYF